MRRRHPAGRAVEAPAHLRAFFPDSNCTTAALVTAAHARWCRLRTAYSTVFGWPDPPPARAQEERAALLRALGQPGLSEHHARRAQLLARAARALDDPHDPEENR